MKPKIPGNPSKRRRRVSKDWLPFTQKLASSLEALNEDEYLILTSKSSGLFVQFMCHGSFGMRAEAVSNNYLARKFRLSKEAQTKLLELGWSSPTHSARNEKSPDQRDPDGSPNYFFDWEHPEPFDRIAQMAIDTLKDVFEVTHPGTLMYKAASTNGTEMRLPQLGLQVEIVPPPAKVPKVEVETNLDVKTLRAEIFQILEEEFEKHSVVVDDDDDIALRWQNVVLFLRVVEDPRLVRLFSPLLVGVTKKDHQYREVNERNTHLTTGKLSLVNHSLSFSMELFVEPFVPEIMLRTTICALMASNELAKDLRPVFGGRPFVGRSDGGTISPQWRTVNGF